MTTPGNPTLRSSKPQAHPDDRLHTTTRDALVPADLPPIAFAILDFKAGAMPDPNQKPRIRGDAKESTEQATIPAYEIHLSGVIPEALAPLLMGAAKGTVLRVQVMVEVAGVAR